MPLSADELQVTTFDVTPEVGTVSNPITAPQPNCYSPLCIPTDLPEQCPPAGGTA